MLAPRWYAGGVNFHQGSGTRKHPSTILDNRTDRNDAPKLDVFVAPETAMRLTHYEKPLQILMVFLLIFGLLQMLIYPVSRVIMSMVGM